MKDKLILGSQAEIELEEGSSLSGLKVLSATKEDMAACWDLFTADNLKTVQIKNSGGVVTGEYENLIFVSETSRLQEDGSILTAFRLREKTELELLREELAAMKEGQEIQDGAIADLGAAVSAIAEGGTQ